MTHQKTLKEFDAEQSYRQLKAMALDITRQAKDLAFDDAVIVVTEQLLTLRATTQNDLLAEVTARFAPIVDEAIATEEQLAASLESLHRGKAKAS